MINMIEESSTMIILIIIKPDDKPKVSLVSKVFRLPRSVLFLGKYKIRAREKPDPYSHSALFIHLFCSQQKHVWKYFKNQTLRTKYSYNVHCP